MIMNRYRLLFAIIVGVLLSFNVNGQQSDQKLDEIFGSKSEVYFSFDNPGREVLNELTFIISLDKVKDGKVFAYASRKEFVNFLGQGVSYEILRNPGNLDYEPLMVDHVNIRDVTDWNFYPTYEGYLDIMQQFADEYPNLCEVFSIGQSTNGREIMFAKISDNVGMGEGEPQFMYTATMHGDETAGYVLMLQLIDYLLSGYGTNDKVTNLVDNLEIWINPLANPDGTFAGGNSTVNGATRNNANGVDLNRNYPDPQFGPHPDGNAWQDETIAFMELAEDNHFVLSSNIHGGTEVCNYPWDTYSYPSADDDWWEYVCREYADTAQFYSPSGYMTDLDNGITRGYLWYPVAGGRQDYMTYFHQGREFTLEISQTKLLPESQLQNWWNYNYRSLLNYMEQGTFGFAGRIKDSISGFPLHAEVYVIGHEEDSSWVYSHLPLGNYARLIFEGNWNLRVTSEGYETRLIPNVSVTNRQKTDLNIMMVPEGVGSISQNEISEGLKLYPVPVSGNIMNLTSKYVVEHLKIYDQQGRMVLRQSIYDDRGQIYLGELPSGTYVVEIVTEKGRGVKNIIVK